jgi:hypothetical protein
MNMRRLLFGLVAMAAIAGAAGQSIAMDGPFYGSACWGGCYPPFVFNGERMPYFTLYPPVYYSGIVPRSIGQSPFAYPPVPPPPPVAVENVVVQPTRPPLRIKNPFVVGESVSAQKPEQTTTVKPLIVYPVAASLGER